MSQGVSPPAHVNSLWPRAICAQRVVATTQRRHPRWQPSRDFHVVSGSVWLAGMSEPLWPLGRSQTSSPTSQTLLLTLQTQPLLWAQNRNNDFVLEVCSKFVNEAKGPQEQMPSAWMLTSQWVCDPSFFLFPSFGQCYNEHLAFCFWLIVEQTDITESALDTTVLRQC